MNDREQVIKHLEFIQGIVNRLGNNSFSIKGWSIAIISAALLFVANVDMSSPQWVICCFVIPVLGFWGLDAYFLWKERLFRKLYKKMRKKPKTDFGMSLEKSGFKGWLCAMFSPTLWVFYAMELIFIAVSFLVLSHTA